MSAIVQWSSVNGASGILQLSLPFTISAIRWTNPNFTIGSVTGITNDTITQVVGAAYSNNNWMTLLGYQAGVKLVSIYASQLTTTGLIQVSGNYSL